MRKARYDLVVSLLPELFEKLESKRLNSLGKEVIKEVLSMGESRLIDVPSEVVEELCKKAAVRKKFYVDEETYLKWKSLPMVFKRWACYWINKKLQEVVEHEDAKG
jgi:hypothetical protein